MTNQIISEFANGSHERIMDFDDTELISPNNNFDFHSFMETNNIRDNNNADFIGTYQDKIEQLNNEKMLMRTHFSNKAMELQTQLVKTKNILEKCETSKAEIEVELTKVNKELRVSQRQFHFQINEIERSKFELSNHFKTLEAEYKSQIVHLNNLHQMLQEQLAEEKSNNSRNQEHSSEKVNQLNERIKEKEKELVNCKSSLLSLENSVKDYQMNILDLKQKVKTLEETDSKNTSLIIEKDGQLESLKSSENKLKIIVVDLTSKINQLESQNFEEKHELNESRIFQKNLQFQLLEIQQKQIIYDKERQLLLDKINQYNKKTKDLEESLNNQVKIASNYREQIKKLENDRETRENSINDVNDDLQMKVEELESKLEIQSRVIEEVNDEISSSRETESIAISNLTRTLEELERFITGPSESINTVRLSPKYNVQRINIIEPNHLSPTKKEKVHVLKHGNIDQVPSSKNIMKSIRNTFLSFQEKINTLESERFETLNKIQAQDRELKNLKSLIRQNNAEQKSLELNNIDKQKEIENLLQEISRLQAHVKDYKQKSDKNTCHLKQTLTKTSGEYSDNIQSRDNYLRSISTLIKEVLSKSVHTLNDKDGQGDPSFNQEEKYSDPQNYNETSTQTAVVDKVCSKDNVELTANLTGTFRFINDNAELGCKKGNLNETRVRHNTDNAHRRHGHQGNNHIEDKKKSSIKRSNKQQENNPYVEDCESWPALREGLSTELVTLLNKYDLQSAQCHQLMSELSAKESLIVRLLNNQNTNAVSLNNQVELLSRGQQTYQHESVLKKSPTKIPCSNQNNSLKTTPDIKKKPRPIYKKVENLSTNMSNKRCAKPVDSQKQCLHTPKQLTNNCETLSKKVTTMSTDLFLRQIVNQQNPSISKNVPMADVNSCNIQKLSVTSPLSTQEAISKCLGIADHGCGLDSRLLSLFVRILRKLINTNSKLQSMENLRFFYKLCYTRSVDYSNLISVNNDLVFLIKAGGLIASEILYNKTKTPRFKVVVHVISICRYMSRKVLSSKLIVQIHPNFDSSITYSDFFQTILSQSAEDIASPSFDIKLIETFKDFCLLNNYHHLLMDDSCHKRRTKKLINSLNYSIYESLKENVKKLNSICNNHVSKVKYKSKQKSYQTNIKSLMIKIKELVHIIDGHNTLIEMREDKIIQQKISLSKKFNENEELNKLIKDGRVLYQNELSKNESEKIMVDNLKAYLSDLVNLCKVRIKDRMFDVKQFLEEEEAIFLRCGWTGCNGLVDLIRESIKMMLELSGTLKTIII